MCDVKKYEIIFEEIMKLSPEDTLQLVQNVKTEEEKQFYELVANYLLQIKQREAIERNMY